LAITSRASGNVLLAADNANNKVDIYDGTFKLVKSFTDTTLPAGFAPFGIQDFGGLVYVSFASTAALRAGSSTSIAKTEPFSSNLRTAHR
jgi:hypothetical protein